MAERSDDTAGRPRTDTDSTAERPNTVNGSSVADLLRPESLLFVSPGLADTDPELREALALEVRSAPSPERRLDHLHYLLGLLHDARATDEGRFLREVFLPWVAARDRTRLHAARVYRELARLQEFTAGTADDVAHVVNIYRNLVADLFDPYATLVVASYQFMKGAFTGLADANLGQGERNKVEYVEARMRERGEIVDILAGYDPVVRNAVSHTGSEGVVYEADSVLFRNIKRASPPVVETVRWTHDELYAHTLALVEFIASVDAAVEVFGMDCGPRFTQDFATLSQLITLAFTPQQRERLRAAQEADLAALRDDGDRPLPERIELLSQMLFANCALRDMPVDSIAYRHAEKLLVIHVPVRELDPSDGAVVNRAMELTRYAILSRAVFGQLFEQYEVRERDKETGTTQLTGALSGAVLDDYADERAGLVDLLADAKFTLHGDPLRVDIDFQALAAAEDLALGGRLPRLRRASS